MSRLKSAPAAKGRSTPARTTAGGRGVYVTAPKSDIYVVMLAISLGAILLGCLLLGLVMNRYDFKTSATALAPSASSPVGSLARNVDLPISDTVRL